MAFKMKGSAFKLNEVATKSALKHSGAAYNAEASKESPSGRNLSGATIRAHDAGHKTKWDKDHNEYRKEETDKSATEV